MKAPKSEVILTLQRHEIEWWKLVGVNCPPVVVDPISS